jgi:hypothetical protein
MGKPRSLHLSELTDADTAEVSLARAFVKFGAGRSAVKFHTLLWWAYPDGQAVGLVLK